jgi:hypothetical protein
VVWSGVTQ